MKKEARQHQTGALEAIEKHNEGIIHLPTGTGKSFIQSLAISNNLQDNRVFVVLAPRILLTNQLYNSIKEELLINKKDCHYLVVHSGKAEDKSDFAWSENMPYREVQSTTSSRTITEEYDKAKAENVPLIIFGTYDSSERIVNANIPVYMLLADEAHYLVSDEFSWIRYENYNDGRKQFNATRKYYFTATLKETISDNGLGMNNSNEFGPIIYSKTPLDMVVAGEILRPRMHFVDCSNYNVSEELDTNNHEVNSDANAIVESFIEHKIHCKIGAKMLIVTKGTEHLNDIVNHPRIQQLLFTSPKLQIFDISSEYKPRINGQVVKRDEFLERLQALDDHDEALIFHVRILTEGIDVPGITSVMIMNNLKLSTFLQTLGRATRLYLKDRMNLYNGDISYDKLDWFVKPYAWIIVPVYGEIGNDLKDSIREIVYGLRTFGFNASEDCVIKENKGKATPVPLEMLNDLDTRNVKYRDEIMEIVHEVEEKEEADRISLEDFRMREEIKNESIDKTIGRFANI